MRTSTQQGQGRDGGFVLLGVLLVLGALAGGHALMMRGVERPPASDFGLGPRSSSAGTYLATLTPSAELCPRKMQTVHVRVTDADGQPVEGAAIAVDGGMPQHGHGLPTKPRVTAALGDGVYEIQGVRFNMGGWWEFKLTITTAAGTDLVTFNLSL